VVEFAQSYKRGFREMPGISRRKLTRRGLPAFFLTYGILTGIIWIGLPVIGWLSMAKESDLKLVSGSVQQRPRWQRTKGGPIIVIPVEMDDGVHDLTVEDLSHYREIMNLRPGDRISARVISFFGYRVWELNLEAVTIESYQDTYLYRSRQNERGAEAAPWFGLISLVCLTLALGLRIYFGTWRDPARFAPVDAENSVQQP